MDGCCWIPTYLYCVGRPCSIGIVIGMLSTVFAVRLWKCEIHLVGRSRLCSGVPYFVRSCRPLLYQHVTFYSDGLIKTRLVDRMRECTYVICVFQDEYGSHFRNCVLT